MEVYPACGWTKSLALLVDVLVTTLASKLALMATIAWSAAGVLSHMSPSRYFLKTRRSSWK